MSLTALIACRREGTSSDPLALDLFSLQGAFLQNRDYRSDVGAIGSGLECPIQRANGSFLMRASEAVAVEFTATLAHESQQALTNPTASGTTAPQFFANIPAAATVIVGFWSDGGTPNNTVLQTIDPVTLAQTTLWTDFQTDPNAGVTGCGLSRNGLTWYYRTSADGTIYALNLNTGVSTSFITPIVVGAAPSTTGTTTLYQLADNTFLVLWLTPGTPNVLRLVHYTALGVASGFDVTLSDFGEAGVFAVEADDAGVWVLGQSDGSPVGNVLQRYRLSDETQTVDTFAPDDAADYSDLLVGAIPSPVPNPTPAAPQTPCTPESETGNGGVGNAGCNTGGVGWTSMYEGPYDTVPQHADPVDGETLTGKRGIDVWIEWNHRDASGSPLATTPHRRSFVELGHLPTYEGGRKQEGLKALGRVSHALGNELHAFETGTVTADYADQTDRLVRTILDGESVKKDELLVKAASKAGVAANTPPRILARSLIERARCAAPMGASLEAVDQISTFFNTRQYPHWKVKDLGDALPADCPPASLEELLKPLYGEKSDEGADPISKGLIPGIYCGRMDLTAYGLATPPDTPGMTFDALVAALEEAKSRTALHDEWGPCLGYGDMTFLQGMSYVPNTFDSLRLVAGEGDIYAVLRGECGGYTTPPPDDTEWGLIIFGLAEWFRLKVNGSSLAGGDAAVEPTRVPIDPSTRSDILHPDYTWPFPDRYLTFTNPATGRSFDVMAVLVRGPLLDDHLNGVVNIAASAMGIMGNAGLPIIDAHACEQHWHENFVQNDWSSGPWTDTTDFPQWSDGTPKVNTTSFAACQATSASLMGGSPQRGLTVGWFPKEARTIKAWCDLWDRDTESFTGVNGHWQIVKDRFDPGMDTSSFARVDHVEHVFGPIKYTPGEDPETIAVGSCDWDADASKFRAGPITRRNEEGIAFNADEEIPGEVIESEILNDVEQLTVVLDWRLARLRFGTTFIDVPRDIGAWDHDVGSGVLFTTIEGTGASGFVGRKCLKRRREFDFASRIVTETYWDVERLLTAGSP